MRKYEPVASPWSLEDELLKNFRLYVFRACGFNKVWAAEVLGVSLRSLRYHLASYRADGENVPSDRWEARSSSEEPPRLRKADLEFIERFVKCRRCR